MVVDQQEAVAGRVVDQAGAIGLGAKDETGRLRQRIITGDKRVNAHAVEAGHCFYKRRCYGFVFEDGTFFRWIVVPVTGYKKDASQCEYRRFQVLQLHGVDCLAQNSGGNVSKLLRENEPGMTFILRRCGGLIRPSDPINKQ